MSTEELETPGSLGISRRRLLAGALTAGAAAAVAPSVRRVAAAADLDAAAAGTAPPDRRWVMIFDLRRCDGCEKCVKACQKMHFLPESQEWIQIHEMTDATGKTYFMPMLCQMCDNPPCVRVCPVGATFSTDDGGILIDQQACIGCRMCMAACPYGVRFFNWQQGPEVPDFARRSSPEFQAPQIRGTVGKCDNCLHKVREGGFPACLEACSMEAVYVGDLVDDVATNGRETVVLSRFLRDNDAFRFKEELGTEPRVYYIAGHGQDLDY